MAKQINTINQLGKCYKSSNLIVLFQDYQNSRHYNITIDDGEWSQIMDEMSTYVFIETPEIWERFLLKMEELNGEEIRLSPKLLKIAQAA
mgnify:CR=1 FL=1|jgi:hypothetical protein